MMAIRTLMSSLIDYAGLFPPAKLDMQTAVRNYAGYCASSDAWALGRFIVPAGRLAEFDEAARLLSAPAAWKLSVLISDDAADDVRKVKEFHARGNPAALDTIECKIINLEAAFALLPEGPIVYFELPNTAELVNSIALLAEHGARAKIRTGGVAADAFPDTNQVADFLLLCAKYHIAFKATAGLHHPLRSAHPFTYEAESASGMMHGFLNVFLAAALAHLGAEKADIVSMLEERSTAAFVFDDEGVHWHRHHFPVGELAEVRQHFAISFGSCSFTEPMEDLKALGWL